MASDHEEIERVKAELHWALKSAVESPEERDDAIGAAIDHIRELTLRDAEALMLAEFTRRGL
jgi:hypothetical protein